MKVLTLSIKQPWLNAILTGLKAEENRRWPTKHRGPLALHAGLTLDRPAFELYPHFDPKRIARGAVLGVADVVGCEERWDEEAGCAYFAWLLKNPRWLLEPLPLKGKLGLFPTEIPDHLLAPGDAPR